MLGEAQACRQVHCGRCLPDSAFLISYADDPRHRPLTPPHSSASATPTTWSARWEVCFTWNDHSFRNTTRKRWTPPWSWYDTSSGPESPGRDVASRGPFGPFIAIARPFARRIGVLTSRNSSRDHTARDIATSNVPASPGRSDSARASRTSTLGSWTWRTAARRKLARLRLDSTNTKLLPGRTLASGIPG